MAWWVKCLPCQAQRTEPSEKAWSGSTPITLVLGAVEAYLPASLAS